MQIKTKENENGITIEIIGEKGERGSIGPRGPRGVQGVRGEKGESGEVSRSEMLKALSKKPDKNELYEEFLTTSSVDLLCMALSRMFLYLTGKPHYIRRGAYSKEEKQYSFECFNEEGEKI